MTDPAEAAAPPSPGTATAERGTATAERGTATAERGTATPGHAAASPRGGWAGAAHWTWRLIRRIHLGTREPENWAELFKFGVVGASGYVVNLVVFAALVEGLGAHHIAAAVGAFVVAVTNNFLWNRYWTFDARGGHTGEQAWRFLTVSLLGLGINVGVLYMLVDVAGVSELPGQALAVAIAMPANFLGNKLWTFSFFERGPGAA